MFEILQDIKSGALPIGEIPSFFCWLLGKSFWFWIAIAVIGLLLCIAIQIGG